MDLKEEDFPLYQLLIKNNQPGVEMAKRDFEAARKGGDEEKFNFALGIQTVAIDPRTGAADYSCVPGQTKEMTDKTLQSCLAVFKDLASRGHVGAAYMVADFKARGLGDDPHDRGPCLPADPWGRTPTAPG